MNLHEGVADFLCDDCGKGFVTRQKLTNHRRAKHTFEKPYICDQCGQGFIRSDKLTVHKRRAHTGEKPYQVRTTLLFLTYAWGRLYKLKFVKAIMLKKNL